MAAPPGPPPMENSPVISTTSILEEESMERRVMATLMASETRGDPPWLCAVQVAQCCDRGENRTVLPNAEVASILVSNICFSHNTPFMWKLLEQAMATKLVYPLHVLALLTPRVIQNRREQPEAYRLYMELIRRYAISFSLQEAGPHKEKITKSIDDALQLSHTYQIEKMDLGIAVVLFLVSTVTSLLDGALLDWGFLVASEGQLVNKGCQSMDVDVKSRLSNNKSKHLEQLRQTNAFTALEILESMCSSKIIQVSLRLVHLNMFEPFKGLLQRLQLLDAQNLSSKSLPPINNLLEKLYSHVKKASNSDFRLKRRHLLGHVLDTGLVDSPLSHLISAGKASYWIPFDILMENAMDGRTFSPASAFEILTGLTKTLQIVNQASWQETFQALWISALRLVQRARDPMAGPIPYIESRLSMLLSIVPLSIAPILKEENSAIITVGTGASSRRQSLVACFQSLIQFSGLLNPPQPVVNAANDAATKAAIVVRDFNIASSNLMVPQIYSTKAVGNLLHLVVESCIARDLIDTSAYFWPGYVVPCGITEDPNSTLIQDCPWSNFMQGAPLTMSLQNALIAIPAPSVAELKKLDHLALHGTEEERSAAPKILCGASLTRGWNIQEHVVHIAMRWLSPEMSIGSSVAGDANPYLSHMYMLAALQSSLCQNYIIYILSLYGVIPDIVAAIIPLCEAFGSFPPPSTNESCTAEEVSPYSIFSFAFLFLLRLCKFHGPDKGLRSSSNRYYVNKADLKLDFLLLMRNSRIHKNSTASNRYYVNKAVDPFLDLRCHSVYVDSFPKLRAWYFDNQACLASDKCNPRSLHQVANKILNLICRNMNKDKWSVSSSTSTITSTGLGSTTFSSSTSGSSYGGSFGSMSGDEYQGQPHYPAWELLESVPLVVDAIFTACAYRHISSRDLTTGLRDLVDFFPASVAAIICYFEAEITRGTWKSVPLNGIDWPSPGEALNSFHLEVKEVLKHVGVHIDNWCPQDVVPMLPLPLAAFLSLTITFKLDKNSEYTRAVIATAIENYAQCCPRPIVLAIGALWIQKARKWHNFIVSLATYSYFTNNKDAVDQLLRSCFKAFVDPTSINNNSLTSTSGVVGLLGESVCNSHAMHPGILFLHTCHAFRAPYYLSEVICKLVVEWACKLADELSLGGPAQLKFGRMSFVKAICVVRQVAILGASLLCVAGRSPLVKVLFEETVPTSLLSKHEDRSKQMSCISSILEGYAMSYLLFFSAAFVWGVRAEIAPDKYRGSDMSPFVIANYLGFIARVTEGNIVLRCDPAMWKAHVSSFVGLIVRFAPAWVPSTKLDALKKISSSLRGWHEYDLALSLLELGGISAIEAALESAS